MTWKNNDFRKYMRQRSGKDVHLINVKLSRGPLQSVLCTENKQAGYLIQYIQK